ncbi:MAG: phosphatase PAP2 family protein [Bacteroidota bacterium]|nr:phosphatase PAP2 family protein [Bacteroidota bacterium]
MKKILFLLPFLFFATANAQNADIRILRCINKPENTGLDKTMRFTSLTVAPMMVGVPAGLLAYEYFRKEGDIRKPGVVCLSLATTIGITLGLKYTVNRPRPFVTYPDIIRKDSHAGPKSFPSGHTSSAFAIATSVSLCYPKWYVIAPAYVWAFTVGYSRMRLGVHYPTDVLIGALIGTACAWGSWELNRYLLRE